MTHAQQSALHELVSGIKRVRGVDFGSVPTADHIATTGKFRGRPVLRVRLNVVNEAWPDVVISERGSYDMEAVSSYPEGLTGSCRYDASLPANALSACIYGDKHLARLGYGRSAKDVVPPIGTSAAPIQDAQQGTASGIGSRASRGKMLGSYVLFMDLVGYSRLTVENQKQKLESLNEIVKGTDEFQIARKEGKLVALPTGDGMALVFDDLQAPLDCAIQIAHALKQSPDLKLRMGIHAGPVRRITDINGNENVAGDGINVAQRVMDCGDAGHILLSERAYSFFQHSDEWASQLHDLGNVRVKHNLKLHLYSLHTGEIGNPELPRKLAGRTATRRRASSAQPSDGVRMENYNREELQRLISEFVSRARRPGDDRLAIDLKRELLDRDGRSLPSDTFKRLGRWCHSATPVFREGAVVARQISMLLFGRVIDREG